MVNLAWDVMAIESDDEDIKGFVEAATKATQAHATLVDLQTAEANLKIIERMTIGVPLESGLLKYDYQTLMVTSALFKMALIIYFRAGSGDAKGRDNRALSTQNYLTTPELVAAHERVKKVRHEGIAHHGERIEGHRWFVDRNATIISDDNTMAKFIYPHERQHLSAEILYDLTDLLNAIIPATMAWLNKLECRAAAKLKRLKRIGKIHLVQTHRFDPVTFFRPGYPETIEDFSQKTQNTLNMFALDR